MKINELSVKIMCNKNRFVGIHPKHSIQFNNLNFVAHN